MGRTEGPGTPVAVLLTLRQGVICAHMAAINHTYTGLSLHMNVRVSIRGGRLPSNKQPEEGHCCFCVTCNLLPRVHGPWMDWIGAVCVFKVGHSSGYTRMKYFLPAVRGGWCVQSFEAFKVKLAHLCWDLASGFVENSFSWVCICNWSFCVNSRLSYLLLSTDMVYQFGGMGIMLYCFFLFF